MLSSQTPLPLNYCEWGQKSCSQLPILMLHGHPGNGAAMAVFGEVLGHERWAIAPDLRGYGFSQVKDAYELADHLQDLTALLDRLNIQSCIVLGWSLGGILAIELALQQPERVQALILVATAARPRSNHPPISLADTLFTAIAGALNWIRPGWRWNIDTFGRRSLFKYLVQRHTPATYRYLKHPAVTAYLKTSPQAHAALSRALRQGYDRTSALSQIEIPTLVLAGDGDRHITPECSQATAAALPQSDWIEYPNTAHLFPWEVPEQVQQDIQQWLTKV
ncbi:MAG: alpha/beta fold hydrolase [Synechococcus sp.]